MSGMEPILIGAAIGAGSSAAMGGDPLQGALLGGATGGVASGLGGAAAGATSGATSGAVSGTTAGAAQAFPVALESTITSSLMPEFAAAALPSSASWAAPHLVSSSVAPAAAESASSGLLGSMSMKDLAPMMGSFTGGGQGNSGAPRMSAPSAKGGQAPNVIDPIQQLLMQQQSRQARRGGRPISLL